MSSLSLISHNVHSFRSGRSATSLAPQFRISGLDAAAGMIANRKIERSLIELQRAVTPDEAWKACFKLMRGALPVSHVLMGLPCLGLMPFFFRTNLVVRDLARLDELAPLRDVIGRRPGLKVARMSDHFIPRKGEPFFEEIMEPQGWLYSAALLFWNAEGMFIGQLAIMRSPAQGDITDAEMALLAALHPHVNAAFERLLVLDRAAVMHKSLEHFIGSLPVAVVSVNWDLTLGFSNHAAREAIAVWQHGRKGARAFKPKRQLPADVRAACERLRSNWTAALAAGDFAHLERRITLYHAKLPGAQATVQIADADAGRGLQPSFTVVFLLLAAEDNEVRQAFSKLSKLTASEQGVARLAAAGHANADVARELGISQSTVRTHLRHVFRKLGITTRAKLSPLHQQLAEGDQLPRRR